MGLNQKKHVFCLILKLMSNCLSEELIKKSNKKTKKEFLFYIEKNRLDSFLWQYLSINALESFFLDSQIKRLSFLSNFQNIHTKKNLISAAKISKAFQNRVDHVFLKGTAILAINENKIIRNTRDIDILIEESDIDRSLKILKSIGFRKQFKNSEISAYDYPRLINKAGVIVEVHFRVLKEDHMPNCILTSSMLKNKIKGKIYDHDVFVPNIEDLVAHAIYHSSTKDYFSSGVNIIYDLDFLLRLTTKSKDEIYSHLKKYKLEKHFELFSALLSASKDKDKILSSIPTSRLEDLTELLIDNNLSNERLFLFNQRNKLHRFLSFRNKIKSKGFFGAMHATFIRAIRFLKETLLNTLSLKFITKYHKYRRLKKFLNE